MKKCSRGSLYIIQNHGVVCPLMEKAQPHTMQDCPVKNSTGGGESLKDELRKEERRKTFPSLSHR